MNKKNTLQLIFFIEIFSLFLSSCGNNFTDDSKATRLKIKKNYNCKSVNYMMDYSFRENYVIINLCGCSNELHYDSIEKHSDLLRKIAQQAFSECKNKNCQGVVIHLMTDSTESKERNYQYLLDENKSLYLLISGIKGDVK